jgi:hypothetical protein
MTSFEVPVHQTPVTDRRPTALRGLAVSQHSVLVLLAVIGIIAGVLTLLASRAITASVLLGFIAVWAIITGTFEIIKGIRIRKMFVNGRLWLIMGIVSKAVAGFVLFAPGASVIMPWIGAYALVFGMFLLVGTLQRAEEL